jgi:PAS domain S-box-containing protein
MNSGDLLNECTLNEARLESLLRITRFETHDVQELLDYALKEAIALTGSNIGYIYYYSEEKREFILNTWSDKVMEACKVAGKQTVYQLDKTGIWGEAVRQRQPIIINDFQVANPLKKGYPEGHVDLCRFLTVPVIIENHIVAVVGVANKGTDYTDSDVRQLTLMMETVWHISEKVRTETELREAQSIIKAAMDCSQAGIAIADAPSGKLRYVNKAGLLIRGKSEAEIVDDIDAERYVSSWRIKNHDGTLLKPEEVPLARAVIYGESSSREFVVERADGDDRTVFANAAPILDDNGKAKAAIVVFIDITEERRTKELLDLQYYVLRGLIDSYHSPIFSVDRNYCYTAFNKAHGVLMKTLYNVEIELGKSILDYQNVEEDRRQAKANIDSALKGETLIEEAWSGDEAHSRMYFEVSHSPVLDQNSEIIGVAVIVNELTDRKKIEEQLNKNIEELARFNKLMIGREQRMIGLKKEVNELCERLEIPARYLSETKEEQP